MTKITRRSLILPVCIALAILCSDNFSAAAQDLPRRVFLGAAVTDDPKGARVAAVSPGTPAALADLRVGDVIVGLGADKITTAAAFTKAAHAAHANTRLAVDILRSDAPKQLELQPAFAPKESDPAVETEYSSIAVDGSLLRTLITSPKGTTGRHPAMLLIGGIGCYSVDNPADAHDSYRFLAHDLSRTGIIVMRVEKAGVGDSQGGPCFNTDFASESKSYAVALTALMADRKVDPRQVFLFGHSIGTLIAPRLALKKAVAGIIVSEGVGINWFEYELANLRRQAILSGDNPTETDALLRSKEVCMHRLLIEHQSEAAIQANMPECKARNAYPVAGLYVQEVAALNIAEPWTKVDVPVLAIYGTADFVTDRSDQERIIDIVNSQHRGTAKLQIIDGMDHHLELFDTQQKAYDVRVKLHGQGAYADQLSKIVQSWLCAHAKCIPIINP